MQRTNADPHIQMAASLSLGWMHSSLRHKRCPKESPSSLFMRKRGRGQNLFFFFFFWNQWEDPGMLLITWISWTRVVLTISLNWSIIELKTSLLTKPVSVWNTTLYFSSFGFEYNDHFSFNFNITCLLVFKKQKSERVYVLPSTIENGM